MMEKTPWTKGVFKTFVEAYASSKTGAYAELIQRDQARLVEQVKRFDPQLAELVDQAHQSLEKIADYCADKLEK